MKFWFIIGAFYLIRAYFNYKKKSDQEKAGTGTVVPKKENSKNLDDIFGDFMKEINKENQPEQVAKPIISNTDTHKAEEDSHKKLDWQEVSKSKFQEKKQLIKHADYKNISHSDIEDEAIVETEVESQDANNILDEIDLRQAVLYKEILDRKYFSI